MITLKNINKSYNNTKVLKNINLTLPDKGLICILGASGSGKSTLLNIIGKIEVPDKGEVYFYNKNINDIKSETYHTNYVSFIYQNYNLIDALSVKDNLNLITKNNEWIINKLGLSKIKNIKTNKISGGEKQRTAIARSILSDSLVYLADEPTGAIDTANSIKIMQILKELSKEKLVLMITHNEDLAHAYADEIIYLKDGTINKRKPTKECQTYKEIFKNKRKLSFKDIFKISMGYLKEQKIRSILTILATTIGLTSLTIVLGINNGLNEEIKSLEKEALYSYPIIIPKEKITLNMSLNNKNSKTEIGVTSDYNLIKNKIDDNLLNKVKTFNNTYISYYHEISNQKFLENSYISPSEEYFSLIKGKMPQNKNEILILLNSENSISESLKDYLKLEKMTYDEILDKTINVENKTLKIVGIVNSNNGYFSALSGILYSNNLFSGEITEIHIYPQNYKAKEHIKNELKNYNIIDDASSALNVTRTLINTITITLTIFSIISLIVSVILIITITYINVLEKNKDIGIYKTLGINRKQIKKIFLNQNYILSLTSSAISIIIVFLIGLNINELISTKIGITSLVKINNNIIISIILISIIITKIASIVPINIATKKKIIDNLHNN